MKYEIKIENGILFSQREMPQGGFDGLWRGDVIELSMIESSTIKVEEKVVTDNRQSSYYRKDGKKIGVSKGTLYKSNLNWATETVTKTVQVFSLPHDCTSVFSDIKHVLSLDFNTITITL